MEELINYNTNIRFLKGVGPQKEKLLNEVGIYTVIDLITYYPRVYEDRTRLIKIAEFVDSENVFFKAKLVGKISLQRIRAKMTIAKGYFADSTGRCQIVWFNQNYISNYFSDNEEYIFYGKAEKHGNEFKITNPSVYKMKDLEKIKGVYPIYPLTKGLTQNYLFNLISNTVVSSLNIRENINSDILKKYALCSKEYAVKKIHMPKDFKEVAVARQRLIFEELLMLALSLQILKTNNKKEIKTRKYNDVNIDEFLNLLPFKLTNAQSRVLNEVISDMTSSISMNRLVEGDVGSGKTMVAAIAAYIAAKNGYQAAIMAPTTILANQHYLGLKKYFDTLGMKTEIITSNTTKKNKEIICDKLKNGEIDIIFGTHSLIEDDIEFKNLALVVTDEQHRFGVNQRIKLSSKGENVETIVMTATPIPRSLALLLYGDLDLSVIDELPPGRKKVATYAVSKNMEERIMTFISKQIDEGRQIYVVCPLVEDSEAMDTLNSVEKLYKEYTESMLGKYKIAYLHGKMKPKEKDEIMQRFSSGEIDILISTTVIEVGVDVPNASCMIIEDSDRFGLAQLHQLRGRVGRGSAESYCILKTNSKSRVAMERLKIMEKTNNGFEIANEDLKLRGPGDFFGIRQSGLPEFKLADLLKDINVLKIAIEAAKDILDNDPYLASEKNVILKNEILLKYETQLKNIGL